MNKNNNKVPIAILSCFLIAFIVQGILKLCGIFIFEKVLNWEIFNIIDNSKILQTIYYSIFSLISIYCLSLSMTSKPYSNKWYHYILIILTAIGTVALREFIIMPYAINILIDIFAYIIIPFIINLTTNRNNKAFVNDCFGIITTLALNIMLYFCYLGLCYWSSSLNSLLPESTLFLSASRNFLIQFEVYVGLITFMLSTNELIKYIIRRNDKMLFPVNIASTLAKKKAKKEKLISELAKLDKEITELESKQIDK